MKGNDCYCSVIGGRKFLCEVCASKLQKDLQETQLRFLRYLAIAELAADVLDYASDQGVKSADIEPPSDDYEDAPKGGYSLRGLAKQLRGGKKR